MTARTGFLASRRAHMWCRAGAYQLLYPRVKTRHHLAMSLLYYILLVFRGKHSATKWWAGFQLGARGSIQPFG